MVLKQHLQIPYGRETLTLEVPVPNMLGSYAPYALSAVEDGATEVARALAAPIGGPALVTLARGAKRVVIVADDGTRLTPTNVIVPLLLEALNMAGVPDGAVEVLVALGTHRQMTPSEIEAKFGPEVVRRIPVVNHDAFDAAALLDLGCTPGGVHVQVNRRVMEADLVLGVGSIVPHHIAGYSGGAKIIQPGVCGERTTGEVHLLSVRRERSLLGMVENPVRYEMEIIAQRAGLRAILNTVLDSHGHLIGAVYGGAAAAFRCGLELSRMVYGVPVPGLADIVVASSSPCDSEFWQAHKTLYAAELCVRQGGTIIVVTPCPEGVAVSHPDMLAFAGGAREEIEAAIDGGQIADLTAGALALAWANVRHKATIYLVSAGITAAEARALGFVPFVSLDEALEHALAHHGDKARVTVLPYAPDTLPLVSGE